MVARFKSRIKTVFKMSNLKASVFLSFCVRFTYSNTVVAFDFDSSRSVPPRKKEEGGKKERGNPHLPHSWDVRVNRAESLELRWTSWNGSESDGGAEPNRAEPNRAESRWIAPRRAGWSMWPVSVRPWCALGCIRATSELRLDLTSFHASAHISKNYSFISRHRPTEKNLQ